MLNLLYVSLIAAGMIFMTSILTYEILRAVWKILPKLSMPVHLRVLVLLGPIFFIHIMSIWLYGLAYFLIQNHLALGHLSDFVASRGYSLEMFENALYFSAVTYTSLGFGGVIPMGDIRMVVGAEVLNGLIMIGWTASFTYLAMERFWQDKHTGHRWRKEE